MREFKINEQQINTLANVILEFPAKQVLVAVDLLRNLPEIIQEVPKDDKAEA